MKSCQLLAFDLDGTLLQKGGALSPLGAKALEAAAKAGIFPVPATGRMRNFLPPALTALPCIRYAVTCNGASVWDLQEGKVLFSRLIPWETAEKVLAILEEYPVYKEFYAGGGAVTETGSRRKALEAWGFPQEKRLFLEKPYRLTGSLRETLVREKISPEKINLPWLPDPLRREISQRLQAFGGLELASSFPDNLEINAVGCSKAQGLQALGAHLGIGREAMAAMGDSGNDRAMLEYAGFPIAMGNASPELKKIARAVAPPCEEDGAALAIFQYILPGGPLKG